MVSEVSNIRHLKKKKKNLLSPCFPTPPVIPANCFLLITSSIMFMLILSWTTMMAFQLIPCFQFGMLLPPYSSLSCSPINYSSVQSSERFFWNIILQLRSSQQFPVAYHGYPPDPPGLTASENPKELRAFNNMPNNILLSQMLLPLPRTLISSTSTHLRRHSSSVTPLLFFICMPCTSYRIQHSLL